VVEASSNEYLDINIPAHAFRVMGLHQGQTLNISLKSQGLVACRDRLSLPGEEV
jgi:antitoxin component of MazEF toxin-antitoxin module